MLKLQCGVDARKGVIGCPHEEGIDYEGSRAAFMPFWTGQAASLTKEMPAGQLVEKLSREAQSILGASA